MTPVIQARVIAILLGCSLILFIFFMNLAPFGARLHMKVGWGSSRISALVPNYRVKNGEFRNNEPAELIKDLAYFHTVPPFGYDSARVKVTFKNNDKDQVFKMGFQDTENSHYRLSELGVPFLDNLDWGRVGEKPYLYQKKPTYDSIKSFLEKPPIAKTIGVYSYDQSNLKGYATNIPGYKANSTETQINTPLRGNVTLYVYLSGEPFDMAIEKRDLNWYEDPGSTAISVYKDKTNVFSTAIKDDGNTKGDHKLGPAQSTHIKNPGPDLPEPGLYKVVIEEPVDTVITKITTNLHKVIFEGPLYPVGNHEIYGGVIHQTTPTTLYSNAIELTARMYHDLPQTILVGDQKIALTKTLEPISMNTKTPTSTITIPKSDVVINGVGYFAFAPEQFFEPTPYHIMQITGPKDLEKVDYVLTNYQPPKSLGDGWVEVEREFDLRDAVIQKGKLSWVISAPGLAEGQRSIEIKDIQMTLSKKGWFK